MARARRYEVQINEQYRDYWGDDIVEVGRITDLSLGGQTIVAISYDKYDCLRYEYQIRSVIDEREGKAGDWSIVLGDRYKAIMYEKTKLFDAIAMHELGHFKNGDLDIPLDPDESDMDVLQRLMNERVANIRNGIVDSRELLADEFACREVGKHTMNMMLDLLIKQRKERGDDVAPLAIREFELRKKALRTLRV